MLYSRNQKGTLEGDFCGDVAEWLGNGLQNRAQQFDSARRLQGNGHVAQLVRALR